MLVVPQAGTSAAVALSSTIRVGSVTGSTCVDGPQKPMRSTTADSVSCCLPADSGTDLWTVKLPSAATVPTAAYRPALPSVTLRVYGPE